MGYLIYTVVVQYNIALYLYKPISLSTIFNVYNCTSGKLIQQLIKQSEIITDQADQEEILQNRHWCCKKTQFMLMHVKNGHNIVCEIHIHYGLVKVLTNTTRKHLIM